MIVVVHDLRSVSHDQNRCARSFTRLAPLLSPGIVRDRLLAERDLPSALSKPLLDVDLSGSTGTAAYLKVLNRADDVTPARLQVLIEVGLKLSARS